MRLSIHRQGGRGEDEGEDELALRLFIVPVLLSALVTRCNGTSRSRCSDAM